MVAERDATAHAVDEEVVVQSNDNEPLYLRVYANAWFQVLLISVVCFCCPGVSRISVFNPQEVNSTIC